MALRIIEEIFNRSNPDSLADLIAENIAVHDADKEITGLQQLRQGITNLHLAFPDLQYTVEDILEEGDRVVIRYKGKGTHRGIFRGIPPTGKHMQYSGMLIWRFADGKLAEHWAVSDVLGMLQQLDVLPPTEQLRGLKV